MESTEVLNKLENEITQLNQIYMSSFLYEDSKVKRTNTEKKETFLISKIVKYFHKILSHKLNNNLKKSINKENKNNNYWNYISKHFHKTQEVRFCQSYENEDSEKNIENAEDSAKKKGKKWIYFCILEESLSKYINEIYKQGLDALYYEKESLLRKNKSEIIKLLKELQEIHFINIMNEEYDKYIKFLKKHKSKSLTKYESKDSSTINNNKKTFISQKSLTTSSWDKISSKEINQNRKPNKIYSLFSNESRININYFQSEFICKEDEEMLFPEQMEIIPENPKKEEESDKIFIIKKYTKIPFSQSVIDNFYTFKEKKDEDNNFFYSNSIKSIHNILHKDSSDSNIIIRKEENKNSELILNPKISIYLPTDNLYKEKEKKLKLEEYYERNDSENISNSSLLYLNNFYKKEFYYQFYKLNLKYRPISIKEQNYQCYICYKRIEIFLGFPKQIFWCSYYMRYVCNDCIDEEFSFIPNLILKKWCFDKFSISKKAKNNLSLWYNKPVIYLQENDILLRKNILNIVINIKKIFNNIFDYMKCKNKFIIIEDIFGEYEYLVLKEYLFSLRDFVEINNRKFFKKLKEFKNKLLKHILHDCPYCKYEGETCIHCSSNEKIFLYDTEKVYYCHICNKSFHKKCIEFTGHFH